MMRKEQVGAAGMEVDRLSQVVHGHGRTFHVPPGTPGTPGAVPEGLLPPAAFPEREVQGVPFFFTGFNPGPGQELLPFLAGKSAIGRKTGGIEIDITRTLIGQPFLLQAADQSHDLGDMGSGPGVMIRRADLQSGGVFPVGGDEAPRQVSHPNSLLGGAADHLVVDIGIILDHRHLKPAVDQVAADHVKNDKSARVADMDVVVDGGSADVVAHHGRAPRPELLLPAGGGIKEL